MSSEFFVTPLDQNVTIGDTATLTCAISSHPPAEITWLFNGNIPESGLVSDSTAVVNNLTLENVGYGTDGEYRCQARNKLTGDVIFSDISQLTIQGKVQYKEILTAKRDSGNTIGGSSTEQPLI